MSAAWSRGEVVGIGGRANSLVLGDGGQYKIPGVPKSVYLNCSDRVLTQLLVKFRG